MTSLAMNSGYRFESMQSSGMRQLATMYHRAIDNLQTTFTINMKQLLIAIMLIVILKPASAIGYHDWQSNINNSCQATISGRAKGVFSKYGFWFDTGVSMGMWADLMRDDPPQVHCKISFESHRNQVKYMQCMAYIQDKWDWYSRCLPIVNRLSREEAGRK
jgi:hypothetical protein